MYLHHIRVYRITLILAIVAITCRISWASTQCKTTVMDVHMKRCRPGADRIKRGLERFDLLKHHDTLKYDEKSKKEEGPDYFKVSDLLSHGSPQKRQLLGQVTSIINPMQAVDSATQHKPFDIFGTNLGSSNLDPLSTKPDALSRMLHLLNIADKFRTTFLGYNDDLGFDLDDEELDELYNDIYKRRPRGSKEEAWKAFLETASKCCQNVDKCLRESTYIPCLI